MKIRRNKNARNEQYLLTSDLMQINIKNENPNFNNNLNASFSMKENEKNEKSY